MNIWYNIKDKEDISLSDDGKELHVNFDSDFNGNKYVSIPLHLITAKSRPLPISPDVVDRITFAEDMIKKKKGKISVSDILAVTYWMQAEMINLNKPT